MIDNNAYAPFGEPYAQTGNGEISYTGQNKDTAWLQYDFQARQYDPKQGRWLSPDPAGIAAADPGNPQSWNRYAYVLNNPLALVDPLGLLGCPGLISGGACAADPSISGNQGDASGQPNLAAMTDSGSICGGGGCGADAYRAYESWIKGMRQHSPIQVTPDLILSIGWSIGTGAIWVNQEGDNESATAAELGLPGLPSDNGNSDNTPGSRMNPDTLEPGGFITSNGNVTIRMRTPFLVSCKAGVTQYATIQVDDAITIRTSGVFNNSDGLSLVGNATPRGPAGTMASAGTLYQFFTTTTGGLMTWFVSGTAPPTNPSRTFKGAVPFRAYAREDIQCQ